MQIVIARATKTGLAATGRLESRDGVNYGPELAVCWQPRALMWISEGTKADVKRAKAFIKSDMSDDPETPAFVFTYPPEENDPLGLALKAVVTKPCYRSRTFESKDYA